MKVIIRKAKQLQRFDAKFFMHVYMKMRNNQPDYMIFFLFFFSFSKPLSLNFSSNINNVLFFPFIGLFFCVFCLYSSYLSVFLWRAFIILYPIIFLCDLWPFRKRFSYIIMLNIYICFIFHLLSASVNLVSRIFDIGYASPCYIMLSSPVWRSTVPYGLTLAPQIRRRKIR